MEFAAPAYGWLAVPVLIALVLAIRVELRRGTALRRFAEPALLRRLVPEQSAFRRWVRLLVPCLGALLLVVALMRPQWGAIIEEESTVGLDLVIAIDVSRSMLADDQTPTRLAAVKAGVTQLLDRSAGDRIGLVAFAGSAFLVCPLTTDLAIVRQMLEEIGPGTIPYGGSSLATAMVEAQRAFRGTPPGGRVLLVLTDGEDHAGNLAPALDRLRSDGVTVIAALAGTAAGGLIPLPGGTFVKDRGGAVVNSRARLAELQALLPGAVNPAVSGATLRSLVERARAGSRESARQQRRQKLAERYHYPLAVALLMFALPLLPSRRRSP
jgi:Ca-activated chloride channel family protein